MKGDKKVVDDFAKALEMEERMFEKVKKYLEENPGKTLEEIADANDIRDKVILKWISQGRIQLGGESSSKKDSRAELAEQFKSLQKDMGSGGGRFDQATKRKGMHNDKKK